MQAEENNKFIIIMAITCEPYINIHVLYAQALNQLTFYDNCSRDTANMHVISISTQ